MPKFTLQEVFQGLRKVKYKLLSDNKNIIGRPKVLQPTLFVGKGEVYFKEQVTLGYYPSPFFLNGISYIEARRVESKITFGKNVFSNNNLTIICEGSIVIGDNVLFGTNVEIIDSDFHEIHPERRNSGNHKNRPVRIENNVFIGSNVKIMKGVVIGENSIIANGSIVTSSIPKNTIAAGNPAQVIREINL